MLGVITIGIDPEYSLGPITLAWHGMTIAIGIGLGTVFAARWLRERDLSPEPLYTLTMLLAVAGLVGGRLFYLAEHGGPLLSSRGFTFDGGVILAALALAFWVWRNRLFGDYLDAIAAGLPFGVAIGRIGDVINGEHYGPVSNSLLAVRNSHPEAQTPDSRLAYENGGLYEVMLASVLFAIVWPLRHRLPRTGDVAWLVLGLFSIGRFFLFFLREDSPELALGLSNTQWTSLVMLVLVIVGRTVTARWSLPDRGRESPVR
ncbi:MAG: prolipoprotein diacylglyceryl transferase [Geodermatophilaceae bacterium]